MELLPAFSSEELAEIVRSVESDDLTQMAVQLKEQLESEYEGEWMCSIYEIKKGGDTMHLLKHRWRQYCFIEPWMVRVYLL